MADTMIDNSQSEDSHEVAPQAAQDVSTVGVESSAQPAYGRMASEFPGWDPYVFGKPEKQETSKKAPENRTMRIPVVAIGSASGQSRSAVQDGSQSDGQSHAQSQGHSADTNQTPQFFDANGNPVNLPFAGEDFDPNDPRKNPVYGRWDVMAIVSLFLSFFNYTAILGLVFGIFSMIRTRKLHMKGFWVALLAVILSAASIALLVYMIVTGTTSSELMKQYIDWLQSTLA